MRMLIKQSEIEMWSKRNRNVGHRNMLMSPLGFHYGALWHTAVHGNGLCEKRFSKGQCVCELQVVDESPAL